MPESVEMPAPVSTLMALDSSIDGTDFKLPLPARFVMKTFMKKKFLTQPLPPGFKAPKEFTPAETPTEEGLAALREAVARQGRESDRALEGWQ